MAEDTRSTSQGTVLSGDIKTSQGTFDLRSWQGLTRVLQHARASGFSDREYAQFRDLVLQYVHGGGDNELRLKIESVLVSLKLIENSKHPIVESSPVDVIDDVSFINEDPVSEPEPLDEPVVSEQEQTREVSQTRAPHSPIRRRQQSFLPQSMHQTSHTPVVARVQPVDIPRTLKVSSDIHTDTAEEEKPAVEIILESIKDEVRVEEAKPVIEIPLVADEVKSNQPKQVQSVEQCRARIAEIKREMHSRVGNPVALISGNNQIGRAYMSALLTAMKAIGPASTFNIEDSMQNLEHAYQAVVEHLNEPSVSSTATPLHEENSDVPTGATLPEVVTTMSDTLISGDIENSIHDAVDVTVTTQHEDVSEDENSMSGLAEEPSVRPKLQFAHIPSLHELSHSDDSLAQEELDVVKAVQEEEKAVAEEHVVLSPQEDSEVEDVSLPSDALSRRVVEDNPAFVASLAHEPTPQQPPAEDSKHAYTGQSELALPEITSALDQLLHEWNIFASSGMFGIGPGGMEHPLYKVIAPLTMAEVMTGRWEKSDRETVRTIKDYVDAWRHEQGVAYNPTETFEHYLRRVLQRIVKRQKVTGDV